MPTEANTANTEVLKKRARQIIDAVIESPVIVEVRAFSQPEEVDRLEDKILALLNKPPVAPAAPDERNQALGQEQEADMLSKLQVAINSCRDVTTLGRFAPSVDPVRWVVQLQAYLESLIEAEAGWRPDPRRWQPVEDELESARTGKVEG